MACISIVDDAGDLKAFLRMDGAAKMALDSSQNKAFTAVSFGMSTDQWWEFIKDDAPLLHGITHTPRLTVFGGGYPIREGDHVIGGIGVSGGHYSQDMQIANAGLASLGTLRPGNAIAPVLLGKNRSEERMGGKKDVS